MEYIYSALLLNKAGKEVNEENVKKVLEAAGVKPNEARVKALVASLQGVDINKAISTAVPVAAAPGAPAGAAPAGEAPKKKKEEKKVSEEEAAAGLGALFG